MTPPAPRHVLMTADCVGGVWTYALTLCRGLRTRGVRVTLCLMGGLLREDRAQALAALDNVTLHVIDAKLEWMENPEDDLRRSGEILLALESSIRPDVVHINGYWHAALPFRAPALAVAHSCVTSWWLACHGTVPPPEWRTYEAGVAAGLAQADMVVVPTTAYLETIRRLHGNPRRARVIPNGRALSVPRGARERAVLAAGRVWDKAKNIATLAEALRGTPIPLYIAGEERAPDGSRAPSAGGIAIGRLSEAELAARMASTAIFASPALYEPFGLGVLEAALCGAALVLSDIETFRELWDGAALFLPPRDASLWRRAIADLLSDPDRCAQMSSRALARAQRYSIERMTNAYCDCYGALIAAGTSAEAAA